jgi:hypothetical protein
MSAWGIRRQARRLARLPNPQQRLASLDRIAAILETALNRSRTMHDPRFPTYRDHREVCCFKCGQQLDLREAHVSGWPTGFWAQHCRACGVTTYYDIVGSPMPQEDTRPDQRRHNNPLA